MTRKLGVLAFIALLGAGHPSAGAAPGTPPAVAASAAQAKPQAKATPTKAARVTTLRAAGKVVKFDSASNTLTVSTPQGAQEFMLSSSSRITEGRKTVAASELGTFTDRQVQVRYTESEGHKTVSSIQVAAAPKAASAKAAPKTQGKPKTPAKKNG